MENVISRVVQDDPNNNPAVRWEPFWTFDAGGSPMGATLDDGCVVFLGQNFAGQWGPLTHVPREAIRFVENLLARSDG